MLDPIWLFLGGLVLRYGGDLAKFIGQFGVQRFTSTVTIAETNPVYSAICWQLDRTGKVRDLNELIYSIAPAIPTAISAPALATKLQPRNGWVGMTYRGAYFFIYRHDFKVTDVQTTQMLSLFTLRPWQSQVFEWLDELEKSYSREFELGYLSAATCARMFDRFFPDTDFSTELAAKLGNAKIAPAAWQSYLQQFDRADIAAANCDFDRLSVFATIPHGKNRFTIE